MEQLARKGSFICYVDNNLIATATRDENLEILNLLINVASHHRSTEGVSCLNNQAGLMAKQTALLGPEKLWTKFAELIQKINNNSDTASPQDLVMLQEQDAEISELLKKEEYGKFSILRTKENIVMAKCKGHDKEMLPVLVLSTCLRREMIGLAHS